MIKESERNEKHAKNEKRKKKLPKKNPKNINFHLQREIAADDIDNSVKYRCNYRE